MPSLFSQFVPSISSMSSDDLSRSVNDGPGSAASNLGVDGGGVTEVGAGSIAPSVVEEYLVVAGPVGFCVTQSSATRTEGLGSAGSALISTTSGGGGGEATSGKGDGAYEVAAGVSVALGVAYSAVGLERLEA